MLPQELLQAGPPPTTLHKAYYPSVHAPSAPPSMLTGHRNSHHDVIRIQSNSLGSTAKGIMIGIFSVLGAAGVCLIIAAIVYYFRYTNQGRIFLDRITRPGEYDDEQQFAKEEAEALEEMDDLQRTEYMRAKGMASSWLSCVRLQGAPTDPPQPLCRPTRPSPSRPTYPSHSSWLSKRRVYRPGNSSQNSRLQTAS
ncbi:SPRY domain containing protein [Pyrenophora tritici-repentis]|nr:SPRY domain containing protein [Pyrenophora tritici-repentis]